MKKPFFLALCLAAALAAGSGSFFDRAETMRRAAVGFAARHGLAEAGLRDRFVALAYEFGGWTSADALRALGTAAPVFLSLLLAAALVLRLPWPWERWGRRLLPVVAAGVFLWGVWNGFSVWRHEIRDPRLLAPVGLLEKASQIEGRVFFNPGALFLAPLFAPEKLEPGSGMESAARLCVSTAEWRAEDRKSPFSGVVLAGRPSQSAPLLEMLLAAPGWRLASIDNQGVLFLRGGKGTDEPTPEAAQALFQDPSARAVYLAQAALILRALQRDESAEKLMQKALDLDTRNPQVLLCAASLASEKGLWSEAREAAGKVLELRPSSAPASYLLALSLFESGALSKAAAKIHRLADRHPDDSQILRLQARIARADNDPSTEVASLEKLLALAKKGGQPVGTLHILLAQAWAKRGFPDQALENYQAALEAKPPPDLKNQIEEAMGTIRQRSR